MRLRALAAIWLAVLGGAGCRSGAPPDTIGAPFAVLGSELDLPETRAAFLEAIVPLDGGDVRVTYAVTGPAGLRGTLESGRRAGGYAYDRWSLEAPVLGVDEAMGRSVPISGRRVVTPDGVWIEGAHPLAPVSDEAPMAGAVADAYLALEPGLRSLVMFRIEEWRALARGGRAHGAEIETILGRRCPCTHVTSHRVCVWEETGLVLRYESTRFAVQAANIEAGITLDDALLSVPDDAPPPARASVAEDPHDLLTRIAAGDYDVLARLAR